MVALADRGNMMGARKKGAWGGPRRGAGPKPGSGGPPELVRRNRVVVMLTDAELRKLRKLADEKDLPLGTAAYEFVASFNEERRANPKCDVVARVVRDDAVVRLGILDRVAPAESPKRTKPARYSMADFLCKVKREARFAAVRFDPDAISRALRRAAQEIEHEANVA